MGSVLTRSSFKSLKESTQEDYKRLLKHYLTWVIIADKTNGILADNLKQYINYLSKSKSGIYVSRLRSILISLFKEELSKEEIQSIKDETRANIKQAYSDNKINSHKADALEMKKIIKIVKVAQKVKIPPGERTALQAFVVALVTLSRMKEITTLTVDDVDEDGTLIRVAPKVGHRNGERVEKGVRNHGIFRAATILKRRRREAIRKGKKFIFRMKEDKNIRTGTISNLLKSLGRRLGFSLHISAHSARKSMAAWGTLQGIPIPIIKAWGLWRRADSLEAYIGPTIRRQMPLLSIVKTGGSSFDLIGEASMK